ncbi:MAG: hypothetical protein HPY85_00280 [Anaerolineae bacterium]|nr:hypothetical protein [Anaerolineae bacterium]
MKLSRYISTVMHPEWFHGDLFTPPYFEGWYFKVVSADRSNAYAFIPGVYLDADPGKSHAFLQVMDGNTGLVHERQIPISEFSWSKDPFAVRIGRSQFSLSGIQVDMDAADFHLTGRIDFGEMNPWEVKWYSPGIMGWFGWLPFMECYHGLLGFDHPLQGYLMVNGTTVTFEAGRGYIEKDWGKAFPSSWVWMQSNHFSQAGSSLSASVAVIPFLGIKFTGVIVGLLLGGRLYRFTTYNGAKLLHLDVQAKHVELVIKRGQYRLHITAERQAGGILAAPTLNGMDRRITESLQGKLAVKLYKDHHLVYDDCGERAGMEIVGTMKELYR